MPVVQLHRKLEDLRDDELIARFQENLRILSEEDAYRDKRRNLVREIIQIHQLIVGRAMDESYKKGWADSGS